MQSHKKLVFPDIPVKFQSKFPAGHINSAKSWNFSKSEIARAASEGLMLTMDLDMPGNFSCALSCPHCFNPIPMLKKNKATLLSDEQIRSVIKQAKTLGLRSVKIIGPGEPLENKQLLPFLEFLAENNIKPLIFTRGFALGNEKRARAVHGLSSAAFADRLKQYETSILFTVNSFDPNVQSSIVGNPEYPATMHAALKLLVAAGFNDFTPGEPTSLCILSNPITHDNYDEIFEVYKWARRRHIYAIASPTMISGNCRKPEIYTKITPSEEELLRIYVKINVWAIEQGIYGLDDLIENGPSAYAGAAPCQQVAIGLFVRKDGTVFRCPGDDISIQGKIGDQSLSEIWHNSENYRIYRGRINAGCPPKDGKSFPDDFFKKLLDEIQKHFHYREKKVF